mgnify:CR=1 FL=1
MATTAVTDASFQSDVLESDKPVLVDFWADWCGPCKMIAPALEELSEELGDKVTVVRQGFDHNERAIAEGDTRGHLKVVMDGKKVLGASIVGRNAGEMLLPFSQLITRKNGLVRK